MGAEMAYVFLKKGRFNGNFQLLAGWGFMKYDLKEHQFESRQVNYLALEPALCGEYQVGPQSLIGLGIGYRPVPGSQKITYNSNVESGFIPIIQKFPNGLNLLLSLTGFF